MKLASHSTRSPLKLRRSLANAPHSERGTATIVVIGILAILLVFVMGNARTLHHLGQEIRFLDSRQKARIQMPSEPATNAPSPALLPGPAK